MKPFAFLFLVLLAGCGGSLNDSPNVGGFKVVYSVIPDKATVGTGETLSLHVSVLEGFYSDLFVSVRKGAAGGTATKTTSGTFGTNQGAIPDGVAYVAPSAPGTYHVDVTFLSGTQVEAIETSTITVTAP